MQIYRLLVFTSVLALPTAAYASESFPEALANAAGMACQPSCTLCHLDSQGGFGTIKPASFGDTLLTRGLLSAGDKTAIPCAIAAVACESRADCAPLDVACTPSDSDHDGEPDITELRQGGNPNDPSSTASLCGPSYGCQARLVARPGLTDESSNWGWTGLLIALSLLVVRRGQTRTRLRG